ncbi:MAG: hypothetical protein AB1746_10265 [Candidatus Zixiibacteriota bacterium]
MLKIKTLNKYNLARYPREHFYKKPAGKMGLVLKYSPIAFSLLVLFEGCDLDCSSKSGLKRNRVGVTGPPPMASDFVTENEAREIINNAFKNKNLEVESDVVFDFVLNNGEIRHLILDGYDKKSEIGYEYIGPDDFMEIDYKAREELSDPRMVDKPNILIIDPHSKTEEYQKEIRQKVESFIDSLKSEGFI